jgi:multicomponent Na+:H+ antiporter subunit E
MIVLLILYLAITGNLQFSNMVLGGIVATLAIVLLRPQPGRFTLRRLPVALLASIRYLVILIADIISSGIAVARVVLNPALPIRPGIIAIPSGCESELATALSAHALSVTPGELVIGIDEQGVLYTHCLDATHAADYIAQAQAMRRNLLSKIIA